MIQEFGKQLVGEVVATDFRTAEIFTELGIDFCCGGKFSILEACSDKKIEVKELFNRIESVKQTSIAPSLNFNEWSLTFLIDYIVNTHHKFVLKNLPDLVFYTQKIATVHGDHHPELVQVAGLFSKINDELLQHLRNEEEVLFPAVKQLDFGSSNKAAATVKSEISRMFDEHDFAGGAMDEINRITAGYKVPEDGCNTYKVAFSLLKEFEDDLHIHVHLENNILFPKALELAGIQ